MAPQVFQHPEARPKEVPLSTISVATERVLRRILEEAIHRFNNELMDDEERMLLLDRIKRLRKRLTK